MRRAVERNPGVQEAQQPVSAEMGRIATNEAAQNLSVVIPRPPIRARQQVEKVTVRGRLSRQKAGRTKRLN